MPTIEEYMTMPEQDFTDAVGQLDEQQRLDLFNQMRNRNNAQAHRDEQVRQQAQRNADIDNIVNQMRSQVDQIMADPRKMPAKEENTLSHVKRILNYQLESVAIGAVFNILIHAMRAGLQVQYTNDLVKVGKLRNVYIPFNPQLHKKGIPAAQVQGKRLLGAAEQYVPLVFDASYHKLLQVTSEGKINYAVEMPAGFQPDAQYIEMLGLVAEPTVLDSLQKEWHMLSSKLTDTNKNIARASARGHGQDPNEGNFLRPRPPRGNG